MFYGAIYYLIFLGIYWNFSSSESTEQLTRGRIAIIYVPLAPEENW
jgi:hypothetical protein